MARRRGVIVIGAVVLAGILGLTVAQSDVPYPDIPRGQGEFCVEDTEFMRRNHMNVLLHQRDETMINGIRSKQHSLKECISCHAVKGSDAIPVTVENPKHFCRSCHDYAAVKIDCFQCHASRPELGTVAKAEKK
jgi:predicted CXXCH cytochrome family protein